VLGPVRNGSPAPLGRDSRFSLTRAREVATRERVTRDGYDPNILSRNDLRSTPPCWPIENCSRRPRLRSCQLALAGASPGRGCSRRRRLRRCPRVESLCRLTGPRSGRPPASRRPTRPLNRLSGPYSRRPTTAGGLGYGNFHPRWAWQAANRLDGEEGDGDDNLSGGAELGRARRQPPSTALAKDRLRNIVRLDRFSVTWRWTAACPSSWHLAAPCLGSGQSRERFSPRWRCSGSCSLPTRCRVAIAVKKARRKVRTA